VSIDGLCPEHGTTKPLSHVNAVDVHPLSPFEKTLFNERMDTMRLGDGIFIIYSDRTFRKKVVTLDFPLAEVQLVKNGMVVTPLVKGEVKGMELKALIDINSSRLHRLTEVTKAFAKWELQHSKNAVISFSGGKDSTVLADILAEFELTKVFIDTRLEFPETYAFIRNGVGNGTVIDIAKAKSNFFSLCKQKGFPKHGYRWCCKTQKFEPFAQYLSEKYGTEEVYVFSGERRWEGLYRMAQPMRKAHKHIPTQMTIQPLLDWFALDIWCYIWSRKLPVNRVYDFFDRAGCWLCPFGLEYRIFLLQFTHPKLYKALGEIGGTKAAKSVRTMDDNTCSEGYRLNWGKIRSADGVGKVQGPCGDTIEVYIKVEDSKIAKAKFVTDGCRGAITCGDAVTELAKGKNISQALEITPDDILARVGQIPESESHCSTLAVNALRGAIKNYSSFEIPSALALARSSY
jgi:3'-phosphoadenosine 5'-phosphosulfate sulfotransferase (PAPS reductase)/FAD synthetase/NifU-like protein involved in Fe-S cluster formation